MMPVRCGKRVAQVAGATAAMAVLADIAITNHGTLAASVATLGHLRWIWIPAAIVLESASMAALAGMQRRLLAAGGARVRVRSMLATTLGPMRCRSRFHWLGQSWAQPSPSAASPGRAQTLRWPYGRWSSAG